MRKATDLSIGHVNLAQSDTGLDEQFVGFVEALQTAGIRQHVLVRDVALAERLGAVDGVTVGPVVRSAVMAYCMMPALDLVHIHDMAGGQAGLLLTLTRSIPYVLTHAGSVPNANNPLAKAVYRRSLCVICRDDGDASIVRHYDPSISVAIVAEMQYSDPVDAYVRLYQNSQRMPIAGSNGIQ